MAPYAHASFCAYYQRVPEAYALGSEPGIASCHGSGAWRLLRRNDRGHAGREVSSERKTFGAPSSVGTAMHNRHKGSPGSSGSPCTLIWPESPLAKF